MNSTWMSVSKHNGSSSTYYTATICDIDGTYAKGEGRSIAAALNSCVKDAVGCDEIPNEIKVCDGNHTVRTILAGWDYSRAERVAQALVEKR